MIAEHFESLLDEFHHLVEQHGVEETRELWKSNREQLDAIHHEAHRPENTSSVEGIVRWMRTPESPTCRCCNGDHVYERHVDLIDPPEKSFPYHIFSPFEDWIHTQFYNAPEGARLRFTVEVLDVPNEEN